MPKFHLNESIVIEKPIDEVYKYVRDFKKWPEWSPWMVCEPDAEVKAEDKYNYWNGELIGEGEMKLVDEKKSSLLRYDLTFLKPWKSESKTWFEFEEVDGGTKVTWFMDSSLPFFLFWMKKMMTALIKKDYKRGLMMMKDMLEEGKVNAKSSFEGEVEFEAPNLVGYKSSCSLDDINNDMGDTFGRLMKAVEKNKFKVVGSPMAVYKKYDMVNGLCEYYAVVPMEDVKGVDDGEFEILDYEFGKALKAKHMGEYKHLGNAWSMLMMRVQAKKLKLKKGVVGIEVYNTMPGEQPVAEYDTDVYVILK
jgi:effector-binding domain-containing protein